MRPDPRPARTRAAILEAASSLLAEQGEEQTSIASIAARAGTSVGSIYGHFGSKDVLTLAMVDVALSPFVARFDETEAPSDPLEAVLRFGDVVVEAAIAEPVAVRALLTRSMAPPAIESGTPQVDPQILDHLARLHAQLVDHLEAGMEAGVIVPSPVEDLVTMLLGLWTGIAAQTLRRDERRTESETTRHAVRLSRQVLAVGLPGLAAA